MKDLGQLHYFLGIAVEHRPHDMFLQQRMYTLELLERAGVGAKAKTPPFARGLRRNRRSGGIKRAVPPFARAPTSDEGLRRGRPTVRPRPARRPTYDPAHCNGPCVAAVCHGPNL
jgi:hypothetical protein